MRVVFHGAARTVTGSMHLLEVGGKTILLDCGMYQGSRKEAFEINRHLPFDATRLDAVVLSHAHIDHSGNIPSLVRAGFRGTIFASEATAELCEIMLRDSAHIQESDVKFVNKRRAREGKHLFEPLYSAADAEEAIKRFRGVGFRAPRNLFPGVSLTLLDAGHILGSSIIRLELSQGKRSTVFVFSGDLGRPGTPIIKDPEVPQGVETLVMESTYGSRCHEPIIDNRRTLQEIIERTVRRGGKVIIPCFAVGRTQEILYQLNALWEEGLLPRIPVYVDSPMAASATEIFKRHPECYDAAMISANRAATNGSALEFPGVVLTRSVDESKAIATRGGSSIIMSASGMCESGRILHHLANNLGDARNTVLFVGFQAEHTLGRKLLNGITPVNVFGEPVEVQAEVARIEGFSAHAGQDELLAWVDGVARGGALRRVALVHGEGDSLTVLREKIRERHSVEVIVPTRGEALDF